MASAALAALCGLAACQQPILDPTLAEPVVRQMIALEPEAPENYFALAKIYEDAGAYDEAEKTLVAAKQARPNDPAVYMTLAG